MNRGSWSHYGATVNKQPQSYNDYEHILMDQVLSQLPPHHYLFNYACNIDGRYVHQAKSIDLRPTAIVIYDVYGPFLNKNEMPFGTIACVLEYTPGSPNCLIAYRGGEGTVFEMVPQRVPITKLFAFNDGNPDKWEIDHGRLVR